MLLFQGKAAEDRDSDHRDGENAHQAPDYDRLSARLFHVVLGQEQTQNHAYR